MTHFFTWMDPVGILAIVLMDDPRGSVRGANRALRKATKSGDAQAIQSAMRRYRRAKHAERRLKPRTRADKIFGPEYQGKLKRHFEQVELNHLRTQEG